MLHHVKEWEGPMDATGEKTGLPDILDQAWPAIVSAAGSHRLDPALVGAVVVTESAGEPCAIRYERGYRYLFQPARVKPKGCSTTTEINAQQCSWGLMQIMGATARELGFRGWLSELCRPEVGLEYGCKYLARQVKRFGSVEAGVAAYNMGSPRKGEDGKYLNQESYVEPVLRSKKALASGTWE